MSTDETRPTSNRLKAEGRDAAADDHDDRLIRWMLGLSPLQRLEVHQEWADGVHALRNARKITE